jgi:hypothetical protein
MQSPLALEPQGRDPWWTLLIFYNSFREIGNSASLFQSDIPDYIKSVRRRQGSNEIRKFRKIEELTGRLSSEQIPPKLDELEVVYQEDSNGIPMDVCLASNIIEVGIDIERLSLMAVYGQPKTTSQYIQVTGRIGRNWQEKPGLVVTVYNPQKPRDRSHFEKFRSYHERLYEQVEPTSLTPFASPVVDRVLHAVMAGYVRQMGSKDQGKSPSPYPEALIDKLRSIVMDRVDMVDPEESNNVARVFDRRAAQWMEREPVDWGPPRDDDNPPLLRYVGSYGNAHRAKLSWDTPNTMRNVDKECQISITASYLDSGEDDEY